MKFTLSIFLILCCFGAIFAQTCGSKTSCKDCVADPQCGWCAPTWQCLNGTATGPNEGHCEGPAWEYSKCTQCEGLGDCRSCLLHASDCWWCASSNKCWHYATGPIGCKHEASCACDVFPSCSSCTEESRGDCYWCGQDNTCRKTGDDTCPFPRHTCPCSDQQDCFGCSNTGGCHWCVGEKACVNTNSSSCPIPITGCDGYCKEAGKAGCAACTNLAGCGWCNLQGECHDVNLATCLIAHTCSDCSKYNYCGTCSNDPGCNWCTNSDSCRTKGASECLIPHSCEAYCNTFTSCETCSTRKGCGWCEDKKSCVESDTTPCFLSHSCGGSPVQKSKGFSAGSFVGGMFLVIGILALALVGYFVYRWKVNKRPAYTELK